jgi:hypothetical protein
MVPQGLLTTPLLRLKVSLSKDVMAGTSIHALISAVYRQLEEGNYVSRTSSKSKSTLASPERNYIQSSETKTWVEMNCQTNDNNFLMKSIKNWARSNEMTYKGKRYVVDSNHGEKLFKTYEM